MVGVCVDASIGNCHTSLPEFDVIPKGLRHSLILEADTGCFVSDPMTARRKRQAERDQLRFTYFPVSLLLKFLHLQLIYI